MLRYYCHMFESIVYFGHSKEVGKCTLECSQIIIKYLTCGNWVPLTIIYNHQLLMRPSRVYLFTYIYTFVSIYSYVQLIKSQKFLVSQFCFML